MEKVSLLRLISIQKQKQRSKMFLWCHVRHINLSKKHRRKTKKNDKNVLEELNSDGIEFPVLEKIFNKIEVKNGMCVNVFGY